MRQTKIHDSVTIKSESFYNIVQIARFTRYANPVSAIAATNERIMAETDDNGNIVKAWLIDPE